MSKSSYSVSGVFFSTDFDRGLKMPILRDTLIIKTSINRSREYRTLRCNQGRQNKTDIRKKVISKYIQKTIENARFWIQIPVCHRKNSVCKYMYAGWQRFEWSKLYQLQINYKSTRVVYYNSVKNRTFTSSQKGKCVKHRPDCHQDYIYNDNQTTTFTLQ